MTSLNYTEEYFVNLKDEVSNRCGWFISHNKEFSPICAYIDASKMPRKVILTADGKNQKLKNDEVIQKQIDSYFEIHMKDEILGFCIAWQEKINKNEGVIVLHIESVNGNALEIRRPYHLSLFSRIHMQNNEITENEADALLFSAVILDKYLRKLTYNL